MFEVFPDLETVQKLHGQSDAKAFLGGLGYDPAEFELILVDASTNKPRRLAPEGEDLVEGTRYLVLPKLVADDMLRRQEKNPDLEVPPINGA